MQLESLERLSRRMTKEDMQAGYNKPKFPPKASLAEQMSALATDFVNEGFKHIREDIISKIKAEAQVGRHTICYYPKSQDIPFKADVMTWLEQEGFRAVWNHDQRDGTWIQIVW